VFSVLAKDSFVGKKERDAMQDVMLSFLSNGRQFLYSDIEKALSEVPDGKGKARVKDLSNKVAKGETSDNWIASLKEGIAAFEKMQGVDRQALFVLRETADFFPLNSSNGKAGLQLVKDAVQERLDGAESLLKAENRDDIPPHIAALARENRDILTRALGLLNENIVEIKKRSTTKTKARNLYKVTLHKGKSPSDYHWLDWYEPVSAETIREVEKKTGEPVFPPQGDKSQLTPRVNDGQALYEKLTAITGSDKNASMLLLEVGIDGIRYPAMSLSGGGSNDVKNYVVFDENTVSIENSIQFSTKPDLTTVEGILKYAQDTARNKETIRINNEALNLLTRFTQNYKGYKEVKVKKEKPDFIRLSNVVMSPEFQFEKIPAANRVLQASINSKDTRYHLQSALLNMGRKEDLLKPMWTLSKFNPKEFSRLKSVIETSKGRVSLGGLKDMGFSYEAREAWHAWDRAANMTPFKEGDSLLDAFRQLKKENKAEYKRLEKQIVAADINQSPLSINQLKKKKFSDLAITAWLGRREQVNRGLDMLIADIREAIIAYERAGEKPPKIVTTSSDGKKVEVDLKEAINSIGDARDYYSPRNRNSGRYKVFVENKKGHSVLFFSDLPVSIIKAQTAIKYPVSKGFSPAVIEKTKVLSESVFESQTKIMDAQQLVNKALEKITKPLKKNLSFEDFNAKPQWETDKKGNKVFSIEIPYDEQTIAAFKSPKLKGHWSDKKWKFPSLKENEAEKKVLEVLRRNANNLSTGVTTAFAEQLVENLANEFKGRGFLKHRIRRSGATGVKVVLGFEEDPILNATQYVMGIAGGTAKKIKAAEMLKAFTGFDFSWEQYQALEPSSEYVDYLRFVKRRGVDSASQNVAYSAVKKYMVENLRNDEFVDRVFGVFRGLAVLKYLGFRIASPIVNLTVLLTSLPATISNETGVSIRKAIASTTKAIKDYTVYSFGDRGSLSDRTVKLFDQIHDNGWHQAQLNQEAIMELQGGLGRSFSKLLNWSMWFFGLTEQLNRVASVAGAAIAGGDFSKERLQKAKKVSDLANGLYGKETLPVIAQTGELTGQVVKMFYTFTKYPHTYLQNMIRIGKTADSKKTAAKNIGYMMLSPAILGGAAAIPGWSLLMLLIEKLFDSDDPEEELYKVVNDMAGDTMENIVRYGLPGAPEHGITIKHSLSIDLTELPSTVPELFGAPASVITDITRGISELQQGHSSRAMEYILPSAGGRPFKAYREKTEGPRTKTGSFIFVNGKQIKPDALDTFWTAAGFVSTRIAKLKDKRWHQLKVRNKYSNMRSAVTETYKDYKVTKDRKKYTNAIKAMREYNKRVRRYKLERDVPMLTHKKLEQSWLRASKPNKRGL
jgi:hypothetical protein